MRNGRLGQSAIIAPDGVNACYNSVSSNQSQKEENHIMEQIVIQVDDKEEAKLLTRLLSSLNFVVSISTTSEDEDAGSLIKNEETDFFAYAGIWEKRDIDLKMIREKAWPRQ